MTTPISANPDTTLTISSNRKALVVDTFTFPVDYDTVAYRNKQGIRVITPKEIDDTNANIAITAGQTILGVSIIGVIDSEWNYQTGELLYVENRKPIARAVDQGEDMRVVIEF